MNVSRCGASLAVGIFLLCHSGLAVAQENLDQGKTAAQLYASDCAICHKSPQGLSSAGGFFGLQSFLREHYTASRESAAAIAAYLRTVDRGPPPDERRKARPRRSKPADAKSADKKPADKKPADKAQTKPAEKKPAEKKPTEKKTDEKKPD
jgi:hypothetical protein